MTTRTVIRLVDDDPAVLDSLAFVLHREGWNVATYGDAQTFLTQDSPSAPGCLVLDYDMPEMNGLQLQEVMNERGYSLPIIFLTGRGDIDTAVTAMKKGAVEFLQKTGGTEKLLAAVANAVSISQKGFVTLGISAPEARQRLQQLTERELAVVELVSRGYLNRQVAAQLAISVRSAENYRALAMKKLQVKGTAELVSLLRLVSG